MCRTQSPETTGYGTLFLAIGARPDRSFDASRDAPALAQKGPGQAGASHVAFEKLIPRVRHLVCGPTCVRLEPDDSVRLRFADRGAPLPVDARELRRADPDSSRLFLPRCVNPRNRVETPGRGCSAQVPPAGSNAAIRSLPACIHCQHWPGLRPAPRQAPSPLPCVPVPPENLPGLLARARSGRQEAEDQFQVLCGIVRWRRENCPGLLTLGRGSSAFRRNLEQPEPGPTG